MFLNSSIMKSLFFFVILYNKFSKSIVTFFVTLNEFSKFFISLERYYRVKNFKNQKCLEKWRMKSFLSIAEKNFNSLTSELKSNPSWSKKYIIISNFYWFVSFLDICTCVFHSSYSSNHFFQKDINFVVSFYLIFLWTKYLNLIKFIFI